MTRCARIRYDRFPVLFSIVLFGAGCASAPPPLSEIAAADAALAVAREAGASDYAPVELGFAEDKRLAAGAALDGRDYADARRLALQAEADAALAEAKSRATRNRNAVQAKTRENATLRAELLGSDRP